MTSDGKSTKTKVVDLDENYNFVVDDFFIWKKSFDVSTIWLNFWRFEIQICQTTSDAKTTNIKVVDLDQNNFVIDYFFLSKIV
jgi:hypothetical protein